ncbi:DUF3889 domain-containing protein [Litchfieldia alkalitelluris]|uniref:DUF3889 domain-containing protein n=1 Tax=Litchfieldia alkalitelluris TaxID=304268 RepID=UPI000998821D|nr:DUF3889 domain-containing protein [Litchfieldia alkalitelluris]
MKKTITFVILFVALFNFSQVEAAPPKYAKWGRLAMQETQKRYPMADIKDYQHVWREDKKDGTTIERFKLWLKQGDREFGVYITFTFDTKTEELKDTLFVETLS